MVPVKMTLANRITILRLVCIPVYVTLLLYYGNTVHAHAPNLILRWTAVSIFLAAFALDIVDGTIARLFRQTTVLGSILDPVADKALVISSLVMLMIVPRNAFELAAPMWFSATVITRDVVLITCSAVLFRICPSAVIKPRVVGKAATFCNAIAIAIVLTGIAPALLIPVAALGSLATLASGIMYVLDGARQLSTPQAKATAMQRPNT